MKYITMHPKLFACLGFAAVIWYPLTWTISALLDGQWTMWEQAISDLGVSKNTAAAVMFNLSMFGTAVLAALFGVGKAFCERRLDRISGIVLICAAPFLIGVGVVNENMGDVHMYTSSLYGIITACAIGISIGADLYYKKWIFAAGSLIISLFGIYSWATMEFTVFEPILTIIATVWILFQGIKMYLYGKDTMIAIDYPDH